jgi:hypothetical protein
MSSGAESVCAAVKPDRSLQSSEKKLRRQSQSLPARSYRAVQSVFLKLCVNDRFMGKTNWDEGPIGFRDAGRHMMHSSNL